MTTYRFEISIGFGRHTMSGRAQTEEQAARNIARRRHGKAAGVRRGRGGWIICTPRCADFGTLRLVVGA